MVLQCLSRMAGRARACRPPGPPAPAGPPLRPPPPPSPPRPPGPVGDQRPHPFEAGVDDADLTVSVDGAPATVTVNLANSSTIVDGYVVEAVKAPEWLAVRPGRAELLPGARGWWWRTCGSSRPRWSPPSRRRCCCGSGTPQERRRTATSGCGSPCRSSTRRSRCAPSRRCSARAISPRDLHGGRRQLPKQPLGERPALGRRRRACCQDEVEVTAAPGPPGRRGADRGAVCGAASRPGGRGESHDHDHRQRRGAERGDDPDARPDRIQGGIRTPGPPTRPERAAARRPSPWLRDRDGRQPPRSRAGARLPARGRPGGQPRLRVHARNGPGPAWGGGSGPGHRQRTTDTAGPGGVPSVGDRGLGRSDGHASRRQCDPGGDVATRPGPRTAHGAGRAGDGRRCAHAFHPQLRRRLGSRAVR